jgi:hypothetical protein
VRTANTPIGSTELLKMDMHFRAPWVQEIISSRALRTAHLLEGAFRSALGFRRSPHGNGRRSAHPQWSSCVLRCRRQPLGAQVNFVHFRYVEPFLTSGGGSLSSTIECSEPLSISTLLLNLVEGCSCLHRAGAPPLIVEGRRASPLNSRAQLIQSCRI